MLLSSGVFLDAEAWQPNSRRKLTLTIYKSITSHEFGRPSSHVCCMAFPISHITACFIQFALILKPLLGHTRDQLCTKQSTTKYTINSKHTMISQSQYVQLSLSGKATSPLNLSPVTNNPQPQSHNEQPQEGGRQSNWFIMFHGNARPYHMRGVDA